VRNSLFTLKKIKQSNPYETGGKFSCWQDRQNRDFALGRKRRAKSTIVKLQPKSKDFTQLLL